MSETPLIHQLSLTIILFISIAGHLTSGEQLDAVGLVAGAPRPPKMGCFACSTMDYDSPTDNICRMLKLQEEQSAGALMRFAAANRQLSGQILMTSKVDPKSGQLTFTGTPLDATAQATVSPESQVESMWSTEDYSTIKMGAESSGQGQLHHHHLAKRLANGTIVMGPSAGLSGEDQMKISTQVGSVARQHQQTRKQQPQFQNYRSSIANNSIRLRPCMDDENFCSIVSVVRLEFVQDTLYQKFWALERNCSKSCNTGCMLIGERVRLRVCSQCCRSANCNIGNGAACTLFRHAYALAFLTMILTPISIVRGMFL